LLIVRSTMSKVAKPTARIRSQQKQRTGNSSPRSQNDPLRVSRKREVVSPEHDE
jgi:hypothetical protein